MPTLRLRQLLAGLALFFFVAAIGFRSCATARGIPILGFDARVFLPQALAFQARGELVNAVWLPARTKIDATGQGRMVYHGFLFPMLLGTLMWRSDYPNLATVIGILHGATTLGFCVLLWNFATRWRWKITPGRLLLIVLLAAAAANYIQSTTGRPEPLAALMLMIATGLMSRTAMGWHRVIAGTGIGLLTATDPVVGMLAGLMFAVYSAWRFPLRRACLEILAAAGLSLLTFASCFFWYPYSFTEWWRGTTLLGGFAFSQSVPLHRWQVFLEHYTVRGASWFLLATIPLVLGSGIRFIRRRYRSGEGPRSPALFYLMWLLFAAALYRFVLYAPWTNYSLLPFMPLGFLLVFHELGRTREEPSRPFSLYPATAIAILFLASLGLAGDLLSRAYALRSALDLPAARSLFSALRQNYPAEIIALQTNLFTFTEDYSNIVFWGAIPPASGAAILLDAQLVRAPGPPAEIPGYRLVSNHFSPLQPALFRWPFLRGDRACGFAVYERIATPPAGPHP